MFCKYCGEKLDEQARFCSKCGKVVETEKEEFFSDNEYVNPRKEKEIDDKSGKILGLGIWSFVLAMIGATAGLYGMSTLPLGLAEPLIPIIYYLCCSIFPVISIILSSFAKNRIKNFVEKYGETQGRASAGKGFTIPARIIAIITLSITAIIIFAFSLV